MLSGAEGLPRKGAVRRPLPKPAAHLSGSSMKNAAFRKRPQLQSAATSQWERRPGSVLTTHLSTSVWEGRGGSQLESGGKRGQLESGAERVRPVPRPRLVSATSPEGMLEAVWEGLWSSWMEGSSMGPDPTGGFRW